ncbi:hypothetical protein BGZ95_003569 [Linnemannia exigua]|uniref:Uncharacterized protein n=1 Tax=Linnemannia exigua TaxID=604196 RepID=A0AAD4DI74_9FUNG|nr:hypothetical protein BGZ95_003569 [Linnemannia exigua]
MTTQGSLNLDCITSDPASQYLYGVASANDASAPNDYSKSRVVIVRSNLSPTSLANLTWTVIWNLDGNEFSYNYPTFTSVSCIVNRYWQAMSVFVRSPYRTTNPADLLPMGFKLDHYGREWQPIQGYAGYGWTSDRFVHMPFYPNSGILSHLVTNHESSKIITGSVDGAPYQLLMDSFQEWMYKIFTTETQANNAYVEHNITHPNLDADFTVHQLVHTVGGLEQGQEPFAVALTSAGLYQFTLFGPDAGKMEGPFKVKIAEELNSLPQRVVRKLNTKTMTQLEIRMKEIQEEEDQPRNKRIGAGFGVAVVVFIIAGVLLWLRVKRRRKQQQRREKEGTDGISAENSMFVGKFEVHSMGLIHENEPALSTAAMLSSSSSISNHTRSSIESLSTRPRLDVRSTSYTYQDQLQLEFSNHPRPNITTTISEVQP